MNINNIKIHVSVKDIGALKAIINLDFGNFSIKGFRVQKAKFQNYKGDELWITPPTYRSGNRFVPMIFFPDKDEWKMLEMKIWDEYYIRSEDYYKKGFGYLEEDKKDEF